MDRLAAMAAFVLVVDTGSFSAAARRLNVGQPAVSKLVAQLEERLGVKLLVRTTRGFTATEAGLNYYERHDDRSKKRTRRSWPREVRVAALQVSCAFARQSPSREFT
jgi:transposase-like protein